MGRVVSAAGERMGTVRLIDVLAPFAWIGVTIYAFVALGWLGGAAMSAFAALVFWRQWHDIRRG